MSKYVILYTNIMLRFISHTFKYIMQKKLGDITVI